MLEHLPPEQWSRRNADHLLSRTSFSGSPVEREAFYQRGRSIGVSALVDEIVDAAVDWNDYTPPSWSLDMDGNVNLDGDDINSGVRRDDLAGWLIRMMYQRHPDSSVSSNPLAGKMLKFYVDHFSVDWNVNRIGDRNRNLILFYRLLAQHSLGNFGALIKDVSWAPAMMWTLNLNQSSKGNVNENFARELMELFTLGVDGGYTEDDVKALAAAMTGREAGAPDLGETNAGVVPYLSTDDDYSFLDTRTVFSPPLRPDRPYIFIDQTEKQFLLVEDPGNPNGPPIPGVLPAIKNVEDQQPGDPMEQGDMAIDIILQQVTCGEHMAWKLWRYFVAPEPNESLVQELGRRLRVDYQYQVSSFLKDVFKSQEFYEGSHIGEQIKDPIDLIFTATNQMECEILPDPALHQAAAELGMSVLFPPNISGWPEPVHANNQWLSAGNTMQRMNIGGLWSHVNPDAIDNAGHRAKTSLDDYSGTDFEVIFPKSLRGVENFGLLLDHLRRRLLPFHRLSSDQERALKRHYERVRASSYSEEEILKELLRCFLSLPEFQMQ